MRPAPDPVPYPRFSAAEFDTRHGYVAELIAAHELDALVVFGNAGSRAEIQYLTGWPPRHDSFLITGSGVEPVLLVQLYNHVPTAEAMASVGRVRWGGIDSIAAVADELGARGAVGRVGTVGLIPFQQHARLVSAVDPATLVDVTQAFRRIRLVKSEEEIGWTRRGAELCDIAMEALVEAARPGAFEYELGAAVENAYSRRGGGHGICFIATSPMAGGGRIVPSQQWSERRIAAGDAIMIELSAGVGGYTSQILRTIAVSGEPPQRMRELHEVADAAFDAIVAAIHPGATTADLLEAASVIDRSGFSVCDDVVHGYGGGYLPPILRTPATTHGAIPDFTLQPGMMVVVQPNVIDTSVSLGVQTGELILVTTGGNERLHRLPRGLLRAEQRP
jgi:Xaa-Pro aminopeptidase